MKATLLVVPVTALAALLLCLLSQHSPRVAAVAPPTKSQLKAELSKLANSVAKKYPQYSSYTSTVKKYLGLALNSKYDLSVLANATILIPTNTEAEALLKKLPFKKTNIPKIYNITAFHLLRIRRFMPQLKALKPGQAVGTQLKQALYKFNPVNAPRVSFGRTRKAPASTWTTIVNPRMYAGPYFVAHGVNKVLIPSGTKV
ncbi:hypothetical protein CLOM_g20780 [Closterium sp. NIES-68]|nr:hypothetical protein CLOM_g20780 [Closterium sp. NIES-68]GJP83505.1 hypothetical protein CLOP_g13650 [Closterium sp. NIES-67]